MQALHTLPYTVTLIMTKVRRGNYVFLSWSGDHGHHVHVYRDGKMIVKWDMDHHLAMQGKATRRIRLLIRELQEEGRL